MRGRAFVDVIAQMNDEVDIFLGHVLVRGEVAGFVVLAGGEREREFVDDLRASGAVFVRPIVLTCDPVLN